MNKYFLRFKCYFKETELGIFYRRRRDLKQFYSKEEAVRVIDAFEPNLTDEERACLLEDVMYMARRYHFPFDEFFLFAFKNKSLEERLEFISDYERIAICEKLNKARNQFIFDDKYETYRHFKKFYKRELVAVYSGKKSEVANLKHFISNHSTFVVKPIDSSCGEGVKIVSLDDYDNVDILISDMIVQYSDGFIAEEIIIQNEELASLHPSSVNTMRISTIRMDDRVIILYPRLRIGQKGTLVDNASAGGFLCVVDTETGIVVSAGDKEGNHCDVHPDTGARIVGFKIPQWGELKELVSELAFIVPDNRYTGWDMALGQEGWVMVEGNARAQFGWQYSLQKGFRNEILSIFNELNISL